MKSLLRKAGWFLCIVLIAGGIAVVSINRNAATQLRAEHEELLKTGDEIAQLKTENEQVKKLRAENEEVQKLRLANKDLPKLRNEVRQLRREVEEAQKLRSENQSLAANQQNGVQAVSPARPAGFIPRSAMADVGLATPEAAVQTIFWAMSNGNIERLQQCAINGPSLPLNPEQMRREQEEMSNQFGKFPGFAITEKQEISDDEVIIQIQTVSGGSVIPFPLKRSDGEWKLKGGL